MVYQFYRLNPLTLATLKYLCINHGDQRVFQFFYEENITERNLTDPGNYRPVSILPIASNILDRVTYNDI